MFVYEIKETCLSLLKKSAFLPTVVLNWYVVVGIVVVVDVVVVVGSVLSVTEVALVDLLAISDAGVVVVAIVALELVDLVAVADEILVVIAIVDFDAVVANDVGFSVEGFSLSASVMVIDDGFVTGDVLVGFEVPVRFKY